MDSVNELFKKVVVKIHGENCILCGSWATTVHHVFEKGIGGCTLNQAFNPINGVPICGTCHHKIHSVIGETNGREAIFKQRPVLRDSNYKTLPLFGETETEIRHELLGMLKKLNISNRKSNETERPS